MREKQAVKKKYVPIPLEETDKRVFIVRFSGNVRIVQTEFTQLDFLQIMSYLKPQNDRLYGQFVRFIKACDEDTGTHTKLDRVLPRRRINGQL